jgi:hypothetical protein
MDRMSGCVPLHCIFPQDMGHMLSYRAPADIFLSDMACIRWPLIGRCCTFLNSNRCNLFDQQIAEIDQQDNFDMGIVHSASVGRVDKGVKEFYEQDMD